MKPETRRIVWLYLSMSFLFHLGLGQALAYVVIFQQDHGLDAFQRSLMNAVFWGVTLVAEIPTGILADRWIGRKGSVVAAFMFEAACFACYGISTTIGGFIVAEICSALSNAFFSGAYTAWLCDSLEETGDRKLAEPIIIKGNFLRCCGWMIGSLSLSLYLPYNAKLPWILGGVLIAAAGLLAIVSMKEPAYVPHEETKTPVIEALSHPPVRFALTVVALVSFVLQVPNMLWGPYFREIAGTKQVIGPIFSIAIAFTAVGAWLAHMANERKLHSGWGMALALIVTAIGVSGTVLMGSLRTMLGVYLLHEIGRGFFFPMREAYLTRYLPKEDKATFLSYGSMPIHFASVLGLLLWGLLQVAISERYTWLASGGCLLAGTLIIITWGLPRLRQWEKAQPIPLNEKEV